MYAEGKKEWPILIIITITGGTKYVHTWDDYLET